MKSKRGWLERQHESGSHYVLTVSTHNFDRGDVHLELGDCSRRIGWEFGKPGDKRAVRKIKKVKALVDEIYEHLVPENQR